MSEEDKEEEVQGEGFVFRDKRSSYLSEEEAAQEQEQQEAQDEFDKKTSGQEVQLDFSTFVLSLTSSAFYYLGDMPDPNTGKKETNLPAVKQTIDMLLMLQDKTKGNLTEDETKLLEQLIYELQIKYVEKTKQQ